MAGGTRSSRESWLRAGQQLLRRGGAPAVKLADLTEEQGLTTGSFYHHFGSMAEYLEQLAAFYGADQMDHALAAVAPLGPRQRLEALVRQAEDEHMAPLDAAMRDWAGSNPRAAEAVRRSDRTLLLAVEGCFRELGHDRAGARARALLLVSAGVARVHPPWPVPRRVAGDILEVLAPS